MKEDWLADSCEIGVDGTHFLNKLCELIVLLANELPN